MNKTVKIAAVFALLVLAAAVCWIFWPEPGDDTLITAPGAGHEPAAESEPLVDEIEVSEDTVDPKRDGDDAPPQKVPLPTTLGDDEGLVEITVLVRRGGPPVADTRLLFWPEFGSREERHRFFDALEAQGLGRKSGSVTDENRSLSFSHSNLCATDAEGFFSVRVPAGITFIVTVRRNMQPPYEDDCRAKVAGLAAGERREVVIFLEAETVPFHGRVVARGPDRDPVSGAGVYWSYSPEFGDRSPDAVADAGGYFVLAVSDEQPRTATILADGFGPAIIAPGKGRETAADALVIELDVAAAVHGTITGPDGPALGAEIHLHTSAENLLQGRRHFSRARAPTPVWKMRADAAGAYRLDGLPAGPAFEVNITLPGKSGRRMPESIKLKPGEERRADFDLRALAALHGRVIDQDGAPVAGAGILVQPPDDVRNPMAEGQTYLLEPSSLSFGSTTTVTDDAGEFAAVDLAPGPWVVSVQTTEEVWSESTAESMSFGTDYAYSESEEKTMRAGATRDLSDLTPIAKVVMIPEGVPEVSVTLQVHRGLYITGRVLSEGGTDLANLEVLAFCKSAGGYSRAGCREDGGFEVGPLLPGEYLLQATGIRNADHSMVRSNTIEATAGEGNAILSLGQSASLRGRVTGGTGTIGRDSQIMVWCREDGMGMMARLDTDGSFEFDDLMPGLHDLFARDGRGRVAYHLGATATVESEPPELILSWQEAATLVVHLDGGNAPAMLAVELEGRLLAMDMVSPGKPQPVEVPPGRLTLGMSRPGNEREISREIEILAGDRKEVRFDLEK